MFGIFDWLQESILKKYAGSLIRHAITALAGVLMSAGFPGAQEIAKVLEENVDPLAAGIAAALVFGIGLLLSFKEKKKDIPAPEPVSR